MEKKFAYRDRLSILGYSISKLSILFSIIDEMMNIFNKKEATMCEIIRLKVDKNFKISLSLSYSFYNVKIGFTSYIVKGSFLIKPRWIDEITTRVRGRVNSINEICMSCTY